MNSYTGWQYLLFDACTQFGLDKLRFEDRIQWGEDHLTELEALAPEADAKTRPLYIKAVQAIRKAQAGKPTGHLVGCDAVCSGIQIMSVITGCESGARATGLVDPDRRPDAYTDVTNAMNDLLGATIQVPRKLAKQATMTSFYGSKKTPKDIFGEDTPELAAFYEAAQKVAPGAWDLLQTLLASWKPWALMHSWKLPDGFDARIKVMEQVETRIEVDELDHATFTYEYMVNKGAPRGLSNAANVVHSLDAYVLRSVHRRCNYDMVTTLAAQALIKQTLHMRQTFMVTHCVQPDGKIAYYIEQYKRSGMADVVILPHINATSVNAIPTRLLEKLDAIIEGMLTYQPFPVVTIHDEFKCHANNMNHLRQQYINILADLAESEVLSDILSQLYGRPGTFPKLSPDLATKIRGSNYALC